MSLCFECGTAALLYVPSCGDPDVGSSVVLVYGIPDSATVFADELLISQQFNAIKNARDPETIVAAKDALAKTLDGYVPQTGGALPSKHLVQVYDIRGRQWLYIRSDKLRNHWRKYPVDKKLLELQRQTSKAQLDRGALAAAWSAVSRKLSDDLRSGIRNPRGQGKIISKTGSGSITDVWDANWLAWVDAVNESLVYSNSDHPNFDLSAAAQIFRGYAGFSFNLGFDPQRNAYGLSASGDARAVLAEAKADLRGYLPDRDGWHALWEFADGTPSQGPTSTSAAQQLDFGYFRFHASISVDAMVGASIMGTVGVEYIPEPDGTVKGKGSSAGTKGEIAAGAFAGVEASAGVQGGLEWDSPERRQNSGKNGWITVFDVGVTIAANAGIGIEAHFKIEYNTEKQKLFVRAGAQLVIGVGAKGGVTASVGIGTAFEFIQYIYHQLVANDFSVLLFISNAAFEAIKALAFYLIVAPARALGGAVDDIMVQAMAAVTQVFSGPADAEAFARTIQSRPEALVFAPPETKGMILYRLSETFFLSREEFQEGAILVVMNSVQSRREWAQVIERVSPTGAKTSRRMGMTRLNRVLDFGSQDKFNAKVREIESQREIAPDTPTLFYA